MKYKLAAIVIAIVFCLAISVQSTAGSGSRKNQNELTLKDFYGKTKTLRLPVERIVILTGPVPFQTFKILQATDKVVGVNNLIKENRYLYAGYEKLPIVANAMSGTLDYEQLISLKPDLVLAAFWFDERLESLLEPDIQVLRFDIGPPVSYAKDVRTLAKILDKQENAEEFITWYESIVNGLESELKQVNKGSGPRVFDFYGGENGRSDGPPYGTYGKKNPWVTPLIEIAGANSVSKNLKGDWIIVDPEWVIQENPDVIIREYASMVVGEEVIGYEAGSTKHLQIMYDKLVKDSPLASTNAVKKGRVHFIDSGMIQTQWFLALPYLVKWFYPTHFSQLNPEQYHQEYLNRFLRIDFDLNKKGVFVFPD